MSAPAVPFIPRSGGDVERFFAAYELSPAVREYLSYHAERYAVLIRTAAGLMRTGSEESRDVLDVGTFLQTELLRRAIPAALVHTLGEPGVAAGGWGGVRDGETHTRFDLNDAQYPDRVPSLGPFGLIVLAEVLEHLYTAPKLVLTALRQWTTPGGHLLLQTPNAARLEARVRLLAGRHPYEMIRESRTQPGHFREYTVAELHGVAASAGWQVAGVLRASYFSPRSPLRRRVARAQRRLPPSLRDGITMTLRRPPDEGS